MHYNGLHHNHTILMICWLLLASLIMVSWTILLWGSKALDQSGFWAKYISTVVSNNIFIVPFTNLMHASAWPLLWWYYDVDTTCFIFSFLHTSLNFSETKLVPASDTIFVVTQILWALTVLVLTFVCHSYPPNQLLLACPWILIRVTCLVKHILCLTASPLWGLKGVCH